MITFVQNAIDAFSLGALYAVLALGVALIFGIMRLINFAHGELIMIGGYSLVLLDGHSLLLMLPATIVVVVLFALAMERIAYRPIRSASPSTLLVTSFALSYLLQNLATLIFGAFGRSVNISTTVTESFVVGSLRISKLSLITDIVALAMVMLLVTFFTKTHLGYQMRAAAEDFRMAELLGVRANTVIAAAFAMSGLLAATVSILLVAQTGGVIADMGVQPVIVAFVATVIGGLGSLPGAALGGFGFGCVTIALQSTLPSNLANYRDAFAFIAVIVVLLARPRGLLARRSALERVV
jgi:branched-chain amino acid transport system permease protein